MARTSKADVKKPAAAAKRSRGTAAAASDTPAPVNKTRHLQVVAVPGKTEDRMFADLVTDGLASNAATAIRFAKPELGDVSLTDLVASLRALGEAVNAGDLAAPERMLSAQAVALNVAFSELARIAHINLFQSPDYAERLFRLAFKAQSQSRATVETIATIKNPQVVFARQANIANGPRRSTTPLDQYAHTRACRPEFLQPSKTDFWRLIVANGWTPERKARQAELIRTWKPWERSTGPKTKAGKAKVARNAWKGGTRPLMRLLARALNAQRDSLEA